MSDNADKRLAYEVERLLNYSLQTGLIMEEDIVVIRNTLLSHFGVKEPYGEPVADERFELATGLLENMLDLCCEKGLITENTVTRRDLESAKIMGLVTPRQSEMTRRFYEEYDKSPACATDYFYNASRYTNYIQVARTNKNIYWKSDTAIGTLELTINLSKPEKDPREIAAAKNAPQSSYPKCLLCVDNAGYEGNLNHPARQNHRIIPLTLADDKWYLQYSPYAYYGEHCIILNKDHIPMKLSEKTFIRLLEFIEKFPHYFIGSNADLPIVGGSILSHDHFQGGRHHFAIEDARAIAAFRGKSFQNTEISIIYWPLSTIRAVSCNKEELARLGMHIYEIWSGYSDESANIYAYTDEGGEQIPHNTVTPIARRDGGKFVLDIALRNNLTTERFPYGIFHPHDDVHHIKKENIGLIEVMGLAILPARLKDECSAIADFLSGNRAYVKGEYEHLAKHAVWIDYLIKKYGVQNDEDEAGAIMDKEIAAKFARVLEDSGVYKLTDEGRQQFIRFMQTAGFDLEK